MNASQYTEKVQAALNAAVIVYENLRAAAGFRGGLPLGRKFPNGEKALQSALQSEKSFMFCLRKTREVQNAVFSPIACLPDELLREIFLQHHAALVRQYRKRLWPRTTIDPVHLTHVCRRWRSIALDTAHLWTLLTLEPSTFRLGRWPGPDPWAVLHPADEEAILQHERRYRALVERSRNNSLLLGVSGGGEMKSMDKIMVCFRQLRDTNRRIHELHVDANSHMHDYVCEIISVVRRTVTVLDLRFPVWRTEAEASRITSDTLFIEGWPNLYDLTIQSIELKVHPTHTYSSLSNLLRLKLMLAHGTAVDALGVGNILQLCASSLEELIVESSRFMHDGSIAMSTVILPRLKHLDLCGIPDDLSDLLKPISCPALVNLELLSVTEPRLVVHPPHQLQPSVVEQFLQRSACQLQFVSLVAVPGQAWITLAPLLSGARGIGFGFAVPLSMPASSHRSAPEDYPERDLLGNTLLHADATMFPELEELVLNGFPTISVLRDLLKFVKQRHGPNEPSIRRLLIQGIAANSSRDEWAERISIQRELCGMVDTFVIGKTRRAKDSDSWVEIEDGLPGWYHRWRLPSDRA